jgi:two-component system copper resistance phosphate regulon response regulator CusR
MSRVVRHGLELAHFHVDTAADGAAGLELARAHTHQLLILDLMLPNMDGWRVCQILRSEGYDLPILMLTARGEVEDKVRGLEIGADDYLLKPFAFPELVARVHALLRRDKKHKGRVVRVADLEIDIAQRRVRRAGLEIKLTQREFELLHALASREGRVLARETIQEQIWMDEESSSNTVDVHIGQLRRKVDNGHELKLIQTIRGIGYALCRPETQE